MIKQAMQYLIEQCTPNIVDIDGVKYCDKRLQPVVEKPRASVLEMSTLSSLIEYIESDIDSLGDKMIIQVVSPTYVRMISGLDEERVREKLVNVGAEVPAFNFEHFIEKESFNIALQSKFIDNEDKALLLQFTGTIESGTLAQYSDDGVSQKATIKTGLASKSEAIVPNPVKLKPRRTFVEVDQPESEFIFRMKEEYNSIVCGIFEADGGAWKLEAMQNIKSYLRYELKEYNNFIVIS